MSNSGGLFLSVERLQAASISQFAAPLTLAELKDVHRAIPCQVQQELQRLPVREVLQALGRFHRLMHALVLSTAETRLKEAGLHRPSGQFVFAILGSGARDEQSVSSDQDHAFVYADGEDRKKQETYYGQLGEVTAALLHEVGYPLCSGNVMASNARWRGALSDWRKRLFEYEELPNWEHIRFLLIATDAMPVAGDPELLFAVRGQAVRAIARSPFMRWKIADQGLAHRVAATMLGGLKLEGGGEYKGGFPIKTGLYTPLVNSIRLWAHSIGFEEPPSFSRIEHLVAARAWNEELADSVTHALRTALDVRVAHHLDLALQGLPLHDYVLADRLSEEQRAKIKQALRTARLLQQLTARQFPKER